ncbi:hypothetical protein EV646_116142 [Kribbella antiqua]|uniref:Uncharacterized protein n=2 Tax=Kribbella antiqua TaxID=2512217 RepID=A0A4V2S2M7_9ACTN|nr:hypothetical protein EV646_116142 [Kribbella antiqua]
MWLELGLPFGAMQGAGWVAGTMHGAPSLVLRVLAVVLLLIFLLRAARWAERVARRKGIYHPQYFVLGPIGLIMALCAKDKTRSTPR